MGQIGRLAALSLVLVACSDGQNAANQSISTTTSVGLPAATTEPSTGTAPGERPPVPSGDDPCLGDPPFVLELPSGFSAFEPGPPGDAAGVAELYDPLFHASGPDGATVVLYHGNSWRLAATLQRELEVLGSTAWLSTLPNGAVLIDFALPPAATGCDYWGVSGHGINEDHLLAVVASLELTVPSG